MILYRDIVQGSTAWLNLRAGIPTASEMSKIITPSGGPSKSAEKYMFELLGERMLGRPSDSFLSEWMARGKEMEAEAIAYYEFQKNVTTEAIGFATNDAGTVGVSPDRLVGEHGCAEFKCPKMDAHVGFLMESGSLYKEHKVQAQSQLWILERDFNDVVSYYPGLPYAIDHTERDEKFIAAMAEEVGKFTAQLGKLTKLASERGWLKPILTTETAFDAKTHRAFEAWSKGQTTTGMRN